MYNYVKCISKEIEVTWITRAANSIYIIYDTRSFVLHFKFSFVNSRKSLGNEKLNVTHIL